MFDKCGARSSGKEMWHAIPFSNWIGKKVGEIDSIIRYKETSFFLFFCVERGVESPPVVVHSFHFQSASLATMHSVQPCTLP